MEGPAESPTASGVAAGASPLTPAQPQAAVSPTGEEAATGASTDESCSADIPSARPLSAAEISSLVASSWEAALSRAAGERCVVPVPLSSARRGGTPPPPSFS